MYFTVNINIIYYPTTCINMPFLFQETLTQVDEEVQITLFQKSPANPFIQIIEDFEEPSGQYIFSTKIIKDYFSPHWALSVNPTLIIS